MAVNVIVVFIIASIGILKFTSTGAPTSLRSNMINNLDNIIPNTSPHIKVIAPIITFSKIAFLRWFF